MSDYRDSDYTLYKIGGTVPRNYFQAVLLENDQKTKLVWVNSKYVKVSSSKDCFLEFKDENGEWDGKAWRIIQVYPKLRLAQVQERQQQDTTIIIILNDDVRDWTRWNKK